MSYLNDPGLFFPNELTLYSNFERASFSTLARVHSNDYIRFVYELSKQVEMEGKSVAFTPRVQTAVCELPPEKVKASESCDTSFSKGSLNAARRAAGSVCKAVDLVMGKKVRNAFCCVRPPGMSECILSFIFVHRAEVLFFIYFICTVYQIGHHAGVKGLLKDSVSCGFCILNNVAIGALHALHTYGDSIQRVAIIDIDVHHGNGTEEIVKRLGDASKIFFFSIHLFDKDAEEGYEFYPGSGDKDSTMNNVVNVPVTPLWRQENRGPGRPARGCNGHFGRNWFRQMIEARLLPPLRAFSPDFIFISAGFDGAKRDVGNCRHDPVYANGLDLGILSIFTLFIYVYI
jgi:acetoin utilization deacetylase AcuC-like enzyme